MCAVQPWPLQPLINFSSLPPSQQGGEQKTCHPNSSCHKVVHKPIHHPTLMVSHR